MFGLATTKNLISTGELENLSLSTNTEQYGIERIVKGRYFFELREHLDIISF